MARLRVIILERNTDDFRFALWADVPAARQSHYASAANVSVWIGATQADTDALKSGAVTEKVVEQRVPSGATTVQIQGFLETQWTNFQTYINNFNPWQRYGSTWDGTTWAMVNNG